MSWTSCGDALTDAHIWRSEEAGTPPLKEFSGKTNYVTGEAVERFMVMCSTVGIVGPNVDAAVRRGLISAYRLIDKAESPIEKMVAAPLVFAEYHGYLTIPAEAHIPSEDRGISGPDIVIIPQFAFVKYRLDFAVIGKGPRGSKKIVALECDGEEYHKDVWRERRRDDYLKSFDIDVVHASGAEIYRDPFQPARTVAARLIQWRAEQAVA